MFKLLIFIFICIAVLLFFINTYSKENYIMIDENYESSAGLSHQISNLQHFLMLAKELKKTPILPKFYLAGHHNNNKSFRVDFTKYLEIPNDILQEIPKNTDVDKIKIYFPKTSLIRLDDYYQKNLPKNQIQPIKWNTKLYQKARSILNKMKGPVLCLHVRRGDMLGVKNDLIHDTSVDNIRKILNKIKKENNFETVYIMTNEKDKNYFDDLKKNFNIKLFSDFPELIKMQDDDNYELFSLENCIMELSNIKVSTFKTDEKKYNYYLSKEKGYQ